MQEELINDSMNCSDVKKKNAAVKEQSLQSGARENWNNEDDWKKRLQIFFFSLRSRKCNLSIFVIRRKPTKCI